MSTKKKKILLFAILLILAVFVMYLSWDIISGKVLFEDGKWYVKSGKNDFRMKNSISFCNIDSDCILATATGGDPAGGISCVNTKKLENNTAYKIIPVPIVTKEKTEIKCGCQSNICFRSDFKPSQ